MSADPVWNLIDRELSRRKRAHLQPSSWAALGRLIGADAQRIGNWKTRGVPARVYVDIATALGWSVDALLGREEIPGTTGHPDGTPPQPADLDAAPGDMTIGGVIDFLTRCVAQLDDATRDTFAAAVSGALKRPDQAERFKRVLRTLLPRVPDDRLTDAPSPPHDRMLGGDSALGALEGAGKHKRGGNGP